MAELKIEKVTEDSPLKAKVQRIYIKSFPLFERVSLEPFFNSVSDGVEIFALSDEEDVVAFFCTLRKDKYYYLFYLAVDEDKRGKGIGSDILSAVIKNARGATVFLDCEGIYPGCKDRAARVKRLCFYHRNGFKEIGPLKDLARREIQNAGLRRQRNLGAGNRRFLGDFWSFVGRAGDCYYPRRAGFSGWANYGEGPIECSLQRSSEETN